MKKIDAASFLHESGLLFEINRKILHPRGFALEIIQNDDGTFQMSQEIQDHRETGIEFSEESIVRGEKLLEQFDKK